MRTPPSERILSLKTISRRPHWSWRLLPLVLGLGALLYYAPLLCRACVISFDSDALALVAQLRSVPNGIGWKGGYYFHSLAASAVNALLNLAGQGWNDYARAYQLVTLCALVGLLLGTYDIVTRAARNPLAGLLAAVAVATLPGMLRLTWHAEDNLVAQAMQLQYLCVYLWYLRGAGRGRTIAHDVALGLSLWAAVIAHHQLNVLWVTPLALLWFLRETWTRRTRWLAIARIYAVAFGLLLVLYVPLTIEWTGRWDAALYLEWVRAWFVPSAFYRSYYFFNQFGWDMARQAQNILHGIGELVRPDDAATIPDIGAVYVVWFALLAAPYVRQLRHSRVLVVLTLFTVIHVPHSLVYESYNLERWDAAIVPLTCACAIVLTQLWDERPRARGIGRWHAPAALSLALLLLAYGASFYLATVTRARLAANNPAWQTLRPVLFVNVALPRASPPRVLLLTETQFRDLYRVSAMYFAHDRALYARTTHGVYFYSRDLYPKRADLTPAAFAERTRDAVVVSAP